MANPRKAGELFAQLERAKSNSLVEGIKSFFLEIEEEADEGWRRSFRLAWLIEKVRRTKNLPELKVLLAEGEKQGRITIFSSAKAEECKKDSKKRGLLIYVDDLTWGPTDFKDTGNNALVLALRSKLGEIKRQKKDMVNQFIKEAFERADRKNSSSSTSEQSAQE